jgi:hypothetical protein
VKATADERTIRRSGEAQLGGISSEKSRELYERGENPGGLHHGGRGPVPIHAPSDDMMQTPNDEARRS